MTLFLYLRVLLKDLMHAVAECYDIIFPWLNLLEDTQKVGTENPQGIIRG